MELIGNSPSTLRVFFMKKITGQFIFIDFDKINPSLGLTESMLIFHAIFLAFCLKLHIWMLPTRESVLPGNKLILIHLII